MILSLTKKSAWDSFAAVNLFSRRDNVYVHSALKKKNVEVKEDEYYVFPFFVKYMELTKLYFNNVYRYLYFNNVN